MSKAVLWILLAFLVAGCTAVMVHDSEQVQIRTMTTEGPATRPAREIP